MINLKFHQFALRLWAKKNFGEQKAYQMLLGVVEEIGELAHAHLKHEQGIRTNENHEENMKDSIGDIVVYLIQYCTLKGWSFEDIITTVIEQVLQRDWTKDKKTGDSHQ